MPVKDFKFEYSKVPFVYKGHLWEIMMKFFSNKKIWQFSGSLLAAVILFWAISSGIQNGKNIAQAALVAQNAQSLAKGFDFFYQDQNRFPSALEFQNNNLMNEYFGSFPPLSFASSICPESFLYKRPGLKSFELNFCLPANYQNYRPGWNKLVSN